MAIPLYLAQTAAEFASNSPKPAHLAWMACHFSPYGTGLTNLPRSLPKDSLLILNDRTPVCGHDPELVSHTLMEIVERFYCRGILLDFQRPGCPETAAIVAEIAKLPCPVAVSEHYVEGLTCPVFLAAPPPYIPLESYIEPWRGQKLWLEMAIGCAQIMVTKNGSTFSYADYQEDSGLPFYDEMLCCKYHTEIKEDSILFTLYRGKEEQTALLKKAEQLGIQCAVGLYQQLGR